MSPQPTTSMQPNGHRPALVIAIDGPAGAGKSTVARLLASRLGYLYLDTGALYRALAWKMKRLKCDPQDAAGIERVLASTRLDVQHHEDGQMTVLVDGEDVTEFLRLPEMSTLASAVSAVPAVRDWLLPVQRRIGSRGAVVAEGRDIGTRVFPTADVKFYLHADTDVRAKRRFHELTAAGRASSLADTRRDMIARDRRDETREHAPLRQADDALMIDTSVLEIDGVLARMLSVIAAKL